MAGFGIGDHVAVGRRRKIHWRWVFPGPHCRLAETPRPTIPDGGVKVLRQQQPIARKQDVAGWNVDGVRLLRQDSLHLLGIEWPDIDGGILFWLLRAVNRNWRPSGRSWNNGANSPSALNREPSAAVACLPRGTAVYRPACRTASRRAKRCPLDDRAAWRWPAQATCRRPVPIAVPASVKGASRLQPYRLSLDGR
jgi:hypothetical protein